MLFTVLYTTCSLAIPWNMIQNRDVSYQSINAVQCPVSICAFICYIFLNKECQRNKDFILKNKSERSNSSFIIIFLHQAFVIWNIFILQALERNVFLILPMIFAVICPDLGHTVPCYQTVVCYAILLALQCMCYTQGWASVAKGTEVNFEIIFCWHRPSFIGTTIGYWFWKNLLPSLVMKSQQSADQKLIVRGFLIWRKI